jgi:hypothetical protein
MSKLCTHVHTSCCIDKTSTAEVSEAINSMFHWYQQANICYAYLSDIPSMYAATEISGEQVPSNSNSKHPVPEIARSRWFSRGWTLQELVAPTKLIFFSSHWYPLGSKIELQDTIQEITGIDQQILVTGCLENISVAKKMSWAAKRETTRVEDMAYCLLGIFNVNMPLLYGEGRKSFTRLQEEIMKVSDDQSLFAWGLLDHIQTRADFISTWQKSLDSRQLWNGNSQEADGDGIIKLYNLLAEHPADFINSGKVQAVDGAILDRPPLLTSRGVQIELPLFSIYPYLGIGAKEAEKRIRDNNPDPYFAAISCCLDGMYDFYLGLVLVPWSTKSFGRCREPISIPAKAVIDRDMSVTRMLWIGAPRIKDRPIRTFRLIYSDGREGTEAYFSPEIHCAPHATYASKDHLITLEAQKAGPHAAIIFTSGKVPRVSSRAKMLPSFAVVLGGLSPLSQHGGPWVTCVLLEDSVNQTNSMTWVLAHDSPSKCCMSRDNLVSILKGDQDDAELKRNRSSSIRQMTWHKVEEKWKQTLHEKDSGLPVSIIELIPRYQRTGVGQKGFLDVVFDITPINLIENIVHVRIGLNLDLNDRAPIVSNWWKDTIDTQVV